MTRIPVAAPAILPSPWCIPGTTHRYSDEQLAIMRSPATVVVGQAFAGTGKSTTGIGYAAANPDKRILVICFNRANAEESKPKYNAVNPNAVVCTAHSLGFRNLPHGLVSRVVKRWGALTLRHELPLLGARGDMRTAAVVASLLLEFFTTTDQMVDPLLHGNAAIQAYNVDAETLAQCAAVAQRLWLAMNTEEIIPRMQGDRNTIAIPPDAYLKRFVMRGGNLGFHTVIFDEAQDANPIMLQLLKNQYTTGSKVIMLGDRHQSIYEFRGAVNAMDHLPDGAAVLPLTQSRRFGPRTAWLANRVLGELKDEQLAIEGMGEDARYDKNRHVLAYLSRTNVDLLARAASVNGEGVHWVGGIENYRVGILNDVYALRQGRFDAIQDPNVKKDFRSWQDFLSAAEHDTETRILAELVETYDSEIPTLVRNLIQNQASEAHPLAMRLCTLHKSKGLEFDFVKISDDTRDVFLSAEEWLAGGEGEFPEQEVNLMYVGFTRARHALLPNFETENWLRNLIARRAARVRRWQPGPDSNRQTKQPGSGASMPPQPRSPRRENPPVQAAVAHADSPSPAVVSGRPLARKVMRPGFISQNNVR